MVHMAARLPSAPRRSSSALGLRSLRAKLLDSLLDSFGQFPFVLKRAQSVARLLQRVFEPGHLLGNVVDHRFLLAERVEVDPHVVEHIDDRVGLGLDLLDQPALRVDGDDPLVGLAHACQEQIDLPAQHRHLAAVLGDVIEVRLAARADLVDVLDLGPDCVDQMLTAGDRRDGVVELGGAVPISASRDSMPASLFSPKATCDATLLELPEHLLRRASSWSSAAWVCPLVSRCLD